MVRLPALLVALALLAPAAAAAKKPQIQAHRGGSITFGKPTFPENTLPGFERAARHHFVVEWDVKLTKDNVPVVIHDDSLDRTTRCTGLVKDFFLQRIENHCKSDVLGAPGSSARFATVKPKVPIPTLRRALARMKKLHATVSLEIKNIPTEKDWDHDTGAYSNRVLSAIIKSKFPIKHLIIQSFWPPNLKFARLRIPSVRTSQLFLQGQPIANAISVANQTHATYLSPGWPIDKAYVTTAHAAGFLVVPYTIDRRADILAAAQTGVDALITNDPFRARRALR